MKGIIDQIGKVKTYKPSNSTNEHLDKVVKDLSEEVSPEYANNEIKVKTFGNSKRRISETSNIRIKVRSKVRSKRNKLDKLDRGYFKK